MIRHCKVVCPIHLKVLPIVGSMCGNGLKLFKLASHTKYIHFGINAVSGPIVMIGHLQH